MNFLFPFLCGIAVLASLFLGTADELANAASQSAVDAATLWFKLAAAMMFWSGLMKVAQKAGLVDKVCQLLRPVIRKILPDADNSEAVSAVSMNVAANLFGLGNAAAPFGIRAMKELEKCRCCRRSVALFVLLNTASIQLFPLTLIMLRAEAGSPSAADCVLPTLVNSAFALICGMLMCYACYGARRCSCSR